MRFYWTTTRILLMGYTISVRSAQGATLHPVMGPEHKYTVAVRDAITGGPGEYHVEPQGIIDALGAFPEIVAIEITDGLGNGMAVGIAQ